MNKKYYVSNIAGVPCCALLLAATLGCSPREPFGGAYQLGRAAQRLSATEFSPDGRLVALATGGDAIEIVGTTSQDQAVTLQGAQRNAASFAFVPDKGLLVSGHAPHWDLESELIVWSLPARQKHATAVLPRGIHGISASSDGTTLAAGTQAGTIAILSLPDLRRLREIRTESDWLPGVRFVPQTRNVVVMGNDGAIGLWNVDSGTRVASAHVPGALALAVSTNHVGVAGQRSVLLDVSTLREVFPPFLPDTTSVAFSPDGREVVFGTSGPMAHVIETRSGETRQSLKCYYNTHNLSARAVGVGYVDNNRRLTVFDSTGHLYDFERNK